MQAGKLVRLLREAAELWFARNAFQLAGALAFYTLFSLAPLVIILVAIMGAVFGEEAARGEISSKIQGFIGVQAAEAVEEAVRSSRVQEAGLLPTTFGAIMLLFGATTVFAQMQASLNQIWGVAARPSRSGLAVFLTTRLLSLGLVLIIGFLLLTSLVLSMAVVAVLRYAESWIPIPPFAVAAVDLCVSLGIATVLFALIFKVLPDVHLEWRDMWEAGALTAALFVAGQYGISVYLTTTAPGSTYGAAGSLVLVLFWVYYSSLIVFFGAAFTRVRMGRRQRGVVPKRTAAKVVIEVLEERPNGSRRKVEQME